jgi:hypothetical protein
LQSRALNQEKGARTGAGAHSSACSSLAYIVLLVVAFISELPVAFMSTLPVAFMSTAFISLVVYVSVAFISVAFSYAVLLEVLLLHAATPANATAIRILVADFIGFPLPSLRLQSAFGANGFQSLIGDLLRLVGEPRSAADHFPRVSVTRRGEGHVERKDHHQP